VSYTKSPSAGEEMAFFCAVVNRGTNTPLEVDFISKAAELSGVNVLS